MSVHDWNPELYLKFGKERLQPSVDLVARIDYANPGKIIDIGCGPGNSTQVLHSRWPDSEIIGADNSPAMIKKASDDYPNQKWVLLDAGKDDLTDRFDIIFSNATIQWISNHEKLIAKFAGSINDSGVLAVQLPLFFDMPIGKSIADIAKQNRWVNALQGVDGLFTMNTATYYYDHLAKYFSKIDIWTTDYYHIMESQISIIEMIRSTGLKPFLERLINDDDKKAFEMLLLDKVKQDYPLQQNGNAIFPFKRLFFVARK